MEHSRIISGTVSVLVGLGVLTGATACGAPAREVPAWDAVVATQTGLWDTVPVTLTWSLADAEAPASLTVELPGELRPLVDTIDATAPDGTPVGRVEIDGATARATWDAGHGGTATAVLPMAWDAADVAAGEDVALTFRAGAGEVRHEVRIRPDEADLRGGRLYGYWTDRANEDRHEAHEALQWRYVTPAGERTPVRLAVGADQEISCDAVSFRALVDGEDGRELSSGDAPEVTCSAHEVELTLEPRTADEALMLLVPTTPVVAAPSYTAHADVAPGPLASTVDRVGGTAAPAPPGSATPTTISWLLAAGLVVALAASVALAAASRRRTPRR